MRRPLTLILGVHRSGTSLLAQGMIAAGADAGSFADVRDPDNPDGYAEHPAVRVFNDRLLALLGASWDNWAFRAGLIDWDAAALAPWRDEAVAVLRAAFPGDGPFVLKAPRCATLAPFWERVVPQAGFALRCIVILRDPAEVADDANPLISHAALQAGPESTKSAAEFPEPSGTAIATYPWISPASEMQEVDICGEPGIAKRT